MKQGLLLLIVLLGGCSSTNLGPTPSPDTLDDSYTGLWLGKAVFQDQSGDLNLQLEQKATLITGEGSLSGQAGLARINIPGKVTGVLDKDNTLYFRLMPNDASYCAYKAVGTRSGQHIQGSFEGVNCKDVVIGSFYLDRQAP